MICRLERDYSFDSESNKDLCFLYDFNAKVTTAAYDIRRSIKQQLKTFHSSEKHSFIFFSLKNQSINFEHNSLDFKTTQKKTRNK